jgi:hypothetical protein
LSCGWCEHTVRTVGSDAVHRVFAADAVYEVALAPRPAPGAATMDDGDDDAEVEIPT